MTKTQKIIKKVPKHLKNFTNFNPRTLGMC